jgi:hypothetical protein
MFYRGVVHIVVAGYAVYHYCLKFEKGVICIVICIVVAGYIVDHYFVMFYRGVVHIVVAVILLNISV